MSSTQARPGRRRARSWRPLVLLVVSALMVVAGGIAVVLWWSARTDESRAAERIQQCEAEHEVDDEPLARSGDQVLERCAWPAPGADADGYHEIAVTVRQQRDGEKQLVAYTFTGPCERLAYQLAGGSELREVDAGQVVDGATGGPVELTAELLEVVPELSPGTLAVLTTPAQPVVDVACVA